MLVLKDIFKEYRSENSVVPALQGISLSFRKNEFVCILGQSGCGKTTLLNIIGGLDRYTTAALPSFSVTGIGTHIGTIRSDLFFRAIT